MRVTAQDFIKTYYSTPITVRPRCVWLMRKKTFEQVNQDIYPVKISNQIMGRPIQVVHNMTEGKIKFVPEEEIK